jgi:tetratricopeptide (TPR) repeat protein
VKKNAIVVILVAGLVVGLSSLATARKNQYKWDNVARIVAIGDVHASYDNFVAVLKNAELIDDELNWIGGETHLVQLGDVADRGPQPRECMDLLMKLEEEAEAAGGRVHALIGNHEGFNLIGITDFITPAAFATYRDPKTEKAWEKAFKAYYKEHLKEARSEKRVLPPEDEVRAIFRKKYPLGYFGHRKAFSPKGEYGRWIRRHKLAVVINGIVFSHGDWSEEMSELGVEKVNKSASDELNDRSPIEGGVALHVKGPLQYRGFSKVPLTRAQQEELQESVDKILANLGVERTVVGHTVTQGVIEPRFGGKHISIDTGMSRFYEGGHQVALEIEGDKLRAIHPEGKVDLPDYLDEDNFFDYLVQVGAVDKGNVSVQAKLSEGYLNQGNLEKAAEALETLLQSPASVPFRYHETLGNIYRDLGKQDEAQKNYATYIDGFQQLIEKTPENPLLKNLLA